MDISAEPYKPLTFLPESCSACPRGHKLNHTEKTEQVGANLFSPFWKVYSSDDFSKPAVLVMKAAAGLVKV